MAKATRSSSRSLPKNIPTGRSGIEFFTTDIGGEHARMLEQVTRRARPDCATVDSFQLALFVKQGALKPVTEFFSKEEVDDLFPFIREGITGPDGQLYAWWWNTDLRVLYRNKELVPEAAQTWEELKAAALKATEKGVDGLSSTAAVGKAPPSTGLRISGARVANWSTRAVSRFSGKAKTARKC